MIAIGLATTMVADLGKQQWAACRDTRSLHCATVEINIMKSKPPAAAMAVGLSKRLKLASYALSLAFCAYIIGGGIDQLCSSALNCY